MVDKRQGFCACGFVGKIFIVGGYNDGNEVVNSCFRFDTIEKNWKEVSGMNEAREFAACTVFQGNIVVSGGRDNNIELNSVESYDVFANKWLPMPNMLFVHFHHNLVCVKDKMFVIERRQRCEVFDNICKKFVYLKHQPRITWGKSVPIGNKLFTNIVKKFKKVYFIINNIEFVLYNN